jgi:FMN-dependent NADH-azoreductase
MAQILRIDTSPRQQGSHSRELMDALEQIWLEHHPNDTIIKRDLATTPVPHMVDATVKGFYTPKEQQSPDLQAAVAVSDELISELLSADILFISVPVYNFSVPSVLKAWIDQIVRAGYTFGFSEEKGFYGLVHNKRALITTAYGTVGNFDGALASINYLEPYLKAILGFIGITDMRFFRVEGTATNPQVFAQTKEQAIAEMEQLLAGK